MPVLDASVVVALFKPGDQFRMAAKTWFAAALTADDIELHAPALILAEVGGVIARETKRADLAAAAAASLRENGVAIHALDEIMAAEAMQLAAQFGLRGADAVYVALAKRLGEPLVTFDKEQLRRPTGIIAIDPSEQQKTRTR